MPESEVWQQHVEANVKTEEYDWTWFTDYTGHMSRARDSSDTGTNTQQLEWLTQPNSGFDMPLLQAQDQPILFYDEVVLYEDFIHDHGVSQLSVKVRVMQQCWYVLLRYWLRLDGVLLKVSH